MTVKDPVNGVIPVLPGKVPCAHTDVSLRFLGTRRTEEDGEPASGAGGCEEARGRKGRRDFRAFLKSSFAA